MNAITILVVLLLCSGCRLGYKHKHPDAATDATVDASDSDTGE
jgi:hypothetical protein